MQTPWINYQAMREIISKEMNEKVFLTPNLQDWMFFDKSLYNYMLFSYEYGLFRVEHLLICDKLKELLLCIKNCTNLENAREIEQRLKNTKNKNTVSYRDIVCHQPHHLKMQVTAASKGNQDASRKRPAEDRHTPKPNHGSKYRRDAIKQEEKKSKHVGHHPAMPDDSVRLTDDQDHRKDKTPPDNSKHAKGEKRAAITSPERMYRTEDSIEHDQKTDTQSQELLVNEQPVEHKTSATNKENVITKCTQETIPISIYVDVDQFIHPPLVGSMKKYIYKFLQQISAFSPDLQTKLFEQVNVYTNQPYCELIESKIHHLSSHHRNHSKSLDNTTKLQKASVKAIIPPKEKKKPAGFYSIKLPVVVGTYEIEAVLKNNIPFTEKILEIKQIDHEIIINQSEFVPSMLSSIRKKKTIAIEGKLFLHGWLLLKIDYLSDARSPEKDCHQLSWLQQHIALNMTVDLMQQQQITI